MSDAATDEAVPECHPDGDNPQGYDIQDSICRLCPDKFTCLPAAIEKKLSKAEDGSLLTIEADREVEAFAGEHITWEHVVDRMKRRRDFEMSGKDVPAELLVTYAGLIPDAKVSTPAVVEEEDTQEDAEAPESVEETSDPEVSAVEAEDDQDALETDTDEDPETDTGDAQSEDDADNGQGSLALQDTEPPEPPAKVSKEEPAKPKKKRRKKAPGLKLEAHVQVSSQGIVAVTKHDVGEVGESEEGWGWWSADKKHESDGWFDSKQKAVDSLLKSKWTRALLVKLNTPPEPKKPTKPKAEKKTAPKPDKPKRPKRTPASSRPESWPALSTGKPMPGPLALDDAQMAKALGAVQVKIGANIQLEYGMTIVRRKRNGDCVTEITAKGFRYRVAPDLAKAAEFEDPTQYFGSLSTVAMWHERRVVSGNDFFNLAKHACTEVRDAEGRVIDRKGGIG